MPAFNPQQTWLLVIAILWSLIWKGLALWRAAKNDQLAWFICILFINTLGILEMIYLGFFQKKYS
jgi:methionyl-tRNA synthetase